MFRVLRGEFFRQEILPGFTSLPPLGENPARMPGIGRRGFSALRACFSTSRVSWSWSRSLP